MTTCYQSRFNARTHSIAGPYPQPVGPLTTGVHSHLLDIELSAVAVNFPTPLLSSHCEDLTASHAGGLALRSGFTRILHASSEPLAFGCSTAGETLSASLSVLRLSSLNSLTSLFGGRGQQFSQTRKDARACPHKK
jgi:hypothetical protein